MRKLFLTSFVLQTSGVEYKEHRLVVVTKDDMDYYTNLDEPIPPSNEAEVASRKVWEYLNQQYNTGFVPGVPINQNAETKIISVYTNAAIDSDFTASNRRFMEKVRILRPPLKTGNKMKVFQDIKDGKCVTWLAKDFYDNKKDSPLIAIGNTIEESAVNFVKCLNGKTIEIN